MRKIFQVQIIGFLILSSLLFRLEANAKVALPEPDRQSTKMQLSFKDTNSLQGQRLIRSLDSFYNIQVRNGFNGSVLVGYKGKVLYERYFGMANREQGLRWNKNTSSQLASTSKPFTATAILWLAQHGHVKVDAPVNSVLKDFPYDNITIRMLLCHRSGLQDYTKMGLNYWRRNDLVMYNEDLLQMFAKHKPRLRFTPNSKFEYCNSNYALLARIVEELTQMSFPDFMKEYVFEPLGMDNTFVYDPLEPMPANRSQGYKSNWSVHEDMFADGVTGDKGIFSTVQDMYKWDQSFYNNSILNKTYENMSYTPQNLDQRGERNYGLGWRMVIKEDSKVIFHNGNWHSNNVLFQRYIKDNFTIVVLGNKFNSGIYRQGTPVYNIVKQYEKLTTKVTGEIE